ncbi:DNA glycosylase AlkZ-like family protein [Kitasatospora paranensis]|uniref:DNA glycosylase AlkZ-like family protein n=1 Tax=Kitasatospora paranensis TaxID=258053 RepID=A0ABW2G076_9ACTN
MDDQELLLRRMHAQFGRPEAAAVAVARSSGGVQAQDAAAARLALRARGVADPAEPGRAQAAGEVVSTWLMRGTLHLVPAADARWMLGLFAARNLAGGARRRRELGLTDEICARALELLPTLPQGPHSRAALVALLGERGVGIDPKGQAPAHLMAYAAAHGLLCRGADVAPREPGYLPMPAGGPPPADPAAALAGRYLAAFGPAGPADFGAWAGLPVTAARSAFEAASAEQPSPGLFAVAGAAGPSSGPPLVRLLGAYDGYLLGYRSRAVMLDEAFAQRINAGGGVIRPAVVADGRVLGTWRRERDGLVVEAFGPLPRGVRAALAEEAAAVAAFLGVPDVLTLA